MELELIKEIKSEEFVKKVRDVAKNKKKWHFHFLTPNCIFNYKNKFAIVFENEETKETCVCFYDKKPKELNIFENLFYGRSEGFDQY
ncbi:MAG: hypothetical protein NTX24_02550 [Candidatus Pacearchaeota archaeon]|nr:hypothetical protein [Candidatus Pacearchaeota archaeon]